jgi:hypothetical protein
MDSAGEVDDCREYQDINTLMRREVGYWERPPSPQLPVQSINRRRTDQEERDSDRTVVRHRAAPCKGDGYGRKDEREHNAN